MIFKRSEENYRVDDRVVASMLSDPASPIALITNIVPVDSSVLDIGAGSGVLARAFKRAGKSVRIDGIEPNDFAAGLADPHYNEMLIGYAQNYFQHVSSRNYNYIVLADVIEHIPDPQEFLSELLAYVNPSTKLIISIPNVAFGAVRLALLNGFFDYTDSGLLERSHLRYFTFDTASALFKSLGLDICCVHSMNRSFYRVEFERAKIAASPIMIWRLAFDETSRSYQYVFELQRVGNAPKFSLQRHGISGTGIIADFFLGRFYDYLGNFSALKNILKLMTKVLVK